MPYVKRKDGKNYLIQSIRRPDGRRGQRMLAYLGQARGLDERIADLTDLHAIQVKLAQVLARKVAKAKAEFTALKWEPIRPWAVKWDDGMPVPFHAQWMSRQMAGLIYTYWDGRAEGRVADEKAKKLADRLDKLRAVAADLERAGAGAG